MKKVLSLVLAIVMMASLLVVSTSAAPTFDANAVVGTSDTGYNAAVANAEIINAAPLNAAFERVVGPVENIYGKLVGSNGNSATFLVDLTTLFSNFNEARLANKTVPSDYVSVSLTKGYSVMNMTYSVVDAWTGLYTDKFNTGLATSPTKVAGLETKYTKPAVLLTLTANPGYVNLPNAAELAGVVTITHNKWDFAEGSTAAGKYTAQTPLAVKFIYDTSDTADITTLTQNSEKHLMMMSFGGNIITQETINSTKTANAMLLWNNDTAAGINYDVAVLFQSVANLTTLNIGATVSSTYAGIDAPYNTLKVVDFLASHAVAEAATVSVALDPDFININGKEYNVYFIEEVEGASTTVKGAKATFVQTTKLSFDSNQRPIASFNLLNNKLGTYIVTGKTLSTPEAAPEAAPEVPNVNTGADNTVNVAIVLAVLALAAAGFVAVKKVK